MLWSSSRLDAPRAITGQASILGDGGNYSTMKSSPRPTNRCGRAVPDAGPRAAAPLRERQTVHAGHAASVAERAALVLPGANTVCPPRRAVLRLRCRKGRGRRPLRRRRPHTSRSRRLLRSASRPPGRSSTRNRLALDCCWSYGAMSEPGQARSQRPSWTVFPSIEQARLHGFVYRGDREPDVGDRRRRRIPPLEKRSSSCSGTATMVVP